LIPNQKVVLACLILLHEINPVTKSPVTRPHHAKRDAENQSLKFKVQN